MTRPSTAQVIAAEARFVLEGHHARLDTAAHCFRVKSDSREGVTYEVTIAAQGAALRGSCTCSAGRHAAHGSTRICKHVAGCFHRGAREGWARFVDGRWVVGELLAVAS